jgi:hypothetical protein
MPDKSESSGRISCWSSFLFFFFLSCLMRDPKMSNARNGREISDINLTALTERCVTSECDHCRPQECSENPMHFNFCNNLKKTFFLSLFCLASNKERSGHIIYEIRTSFFLPLRFRFEMILERTKNVYVHGCTVWFSNFDAVASTAKWQIKV